MSVVGSVAVGGIGVGDGCTGSRVGVAVACDSGSSSTGTGVRVGVGVAAGVVVEHPHRMINNRLMVNTQVHLRIDSSAEF
jgi:hypothetical protein